MDNRSVADPLYLVTPGRTPDNRGNLKAVERTERIAWQARLRWRYLQEPWTSKICAVCDNDRIQVHHASYGQPRTTELLAVVPLCADCHKTFEFVIWPAAKGIIPRSLATLMWVVHGPALLEWVEWATPITIEDTFGEQLALWDVGP